MSLACFSLAYGRSGICCVSICTVSSKASTLEYHYLASLAVPLCQISGTNVNNISGTNVLQNLKLVVLKYNKTWPAVLSLFA
jgi:hypothetical protein